jgi:hypothetical protein
MVFRWGTRLTPPIRMFGTLATGSPTIEMMSSQFIASLPSEQPAIAGFLKETFHADPALISFRSDVIHWKYFSDHPEWHGTRSYVIKKDDRIVAHGGVWPLHFVKAGTELKVIHLIDWVASRSSAGAGVLLLSKLAGMADMLLTIGGSPVTQAILPKIGYRQVGEFKLHARVVRPGLQFRSTPDRNWKAPLRLLRNAMWSASSLPATPKGLHASRLSQFDSQLESSLHRSAMEVFTSRRTAAGLNHVLNCPAASFSAFVVHHFQRPCGYFLLSQVGKQTRIVDIGVESNDPEAWTAACILATRTAAAIPETCEIVAGFSMDRANEALGKVGFRRRGTIPVFCYDPKKLLGTESVLDLSMLDGDLCFITNPRNPFLT